MTSKNFFQYFALLIIATIIFIIVLGFILSVWAEEKTQHFTTLIPKDIKVFSIDADALAEKAATLLGLSLGDYKGKIKVLKKQDMLTLYKELFEAEIDVNSFYIANTHTVYISAENYNEETLIHELTHAIVTSYFVVPPSVQIQEILAKYTEYVLIREKKNAEKR